LFLSTDMGMGGGAEEQVIHLAQTFTARGWATQIVSMLPPSPMPPGFERCGIPLAHLAMRRGIPNPASIRRLARIIREFQPQVVHSHMTHANLLARAVRVIQPYPVGVGTLHALNMAGVERDRSAIFEAAHRLTDGLTDCTTAICHAAADYYVRRKAVPAAKMTVVHNGIDTARFQPDQAARDRLRRQLHIENRFAWLAVGRLELAKAYPTLLGAFARSKDKSAILLICGQGSLENSLSALATDLKIADRVKFLGLRSDIPDVMNAADAFALSSDSEGLPLVLLQAAAVGLPIVSTDVGGTGEAVVDGVNGYLAPPGSPEAFAQAMDRLAGLAPDAAAVLGRAGRTRVRELFETDRVVDRWEQLYATLLERRTTHVGSASRTDSPASETAVRDADPTRLCGVRGTQASS
jgi:glycosyltransferase involved in cell wall biosynthesis